MSIHLNEEDRASLERLEKTPMKPTRRQKAIVLLRLAEGLSPADAAQHAGISQDEVEALAARFAESGMAGVGLSDEPKNVVRPKNAALDEPWRATIPSFQDEELFREYTESLKALGRDLGQDEDQEP